MAKVNYTKLLKLYESREEEAPRLLRESLKAGDLKPKDFDLGALFVECFGWQAFQECRKDKANLATAVMEAAGGVSTAAFTSISGQIVYAETLKGYESEEFVFSKLIPERQSPYSFEKIAGITPIGGEVLKVGEGEQYPFAGVGQTWIHGPETEKRGLIVPVTREAVFFDRTGDLLEKCGQVGYWVGQEQEERAIDCLIDENGPAKSAALGGHRYHWRDTSIATYGDNSGSHTFDNLAASNALVDWTDVDVVEQLLNEMLDPDTGKPIMVNATHLIVTKQLEKTAMRIADSTKLQVVTPGYATSGNPTVTEINNPYSGKFTVLSSRLLAARMATDTSWYYGSPAKAFFCAVNFPFQTKQAPPNSHDEFHRDIVLQYRADARNNYGTKEPRLMTKATA